jgi:hypothetical protein
MLLFAFTAIAYVTLGRAPGMSPLKARDMHGAVSMLHSDR